MSKNKINLILINRPQKEFAWDLGDIFISEPIVDSINQILKANLLDPSIKAWYLCDPSLCNPNSSVIQNLLRKPGDVWHGGLSLGLKNQPECLKYVAPQWMLIVDPKDDIEAISWRLSLRSCLIKADILRTLGLPSAKYLSLEAAGLELGKRYISKGAIIKNTPAFSPNKTQKEIRIRFDDEIRFIFDTYGKKWADWTLIHCLPSKPVPTIRTFLQMKKWIRGTIDAPNSSIPDGFTNAKISVVLPTFNRYDYLPGCLESLRSQSKKPDEIIVVDQNKMEDRRPDIYKNFNDLNITVIWQNETGQCKARNAAIVEATGEYLFFADDDSSYHPETIQQHESALTFFGADGSTGISVPPQKYTIPHEYTYFRIASNLDTGNSLIKKSTVMRAGGFDLNYDYGKGADQDLGMRIYLTGGVLVHNPIAQRVHYKAKGGLRDFGVLWNNRSVRKSMPRPPVTTVYYLMRFFPEHLRKQAIFQAIYTAQIPSSQVREKRTKGIIMALMNEFIKLPRTLILLRGINRKAKKMIELGPQLLDK
ncbi:MAG: glycosyltransferase family A protein [Anaerolineaceae bacterium]|jgi:glycosyltransferase involved in cell wall biosynthesis